MKIEIPGSLCCVTAATFILLAVFVGNYRLAVATTTAKPVKKSTASTAAPVHYKVAAKDTVYSIAKKFSVSQSSVIAANKLSENGKIKPGQTLFIPNAQRSAKLAVAVKKKEKLTINPPRLLAEIAYANEASAIDNGNDDDGTIAHGDTSKTLSLIRPINGTVSQGLHGYNAVDFHADIGTPVYAAAEGRVILIKGGNAWNGGYGNYLAIEHAGGVQTVYAHLSKIEASLGEKVSPGQVIALSGNTGKTTGPHLHFEVRGAKNPFAK